MVLVGNAIRDIDNWEEREVMETKAERISADKNFGKQIMHLPDEAEKENKTKHYELL